MSRNRTTIPSIANDLWDMAGGFLHSIGDRLERSFLKKRNKAQRWLMEVTVWGLAIFMSLALVVLGLIFLVIDFGGVPRGIVFVCGGLLGLLVLRFVIPWVE